MPLIQFNDLFIMLLLAAAILTIVTYGFDQDLQDNLYTGGILLLIVLVQTSMSFSQEHKTAKLMDVFAVRRNGLFSQAFPEM